MRITPYQIESDKPVTPAEIEDLRSAVGWDRFEGKYDRVLKSSYTHFTVRQGRRLIAFLHIISDCVGDAFLVDLMVHPDFQRRGLGKAIVARAIRVLTRDGIRCIQATFKPEHEKFYRKCGFHIFKAGIIDNGDPRRKLITQRRPDR